MKAMFATLLTACAFTAMPVIAADAQRPDFSGVWTWNRDAGTRGSSKIGESWPKDPPFTALGKQKVAEYRALVEPEGISPGGYCVGYGMPAAMLGSGGYPMEWIQRPEQITVIYEAHNEVRRIYMNVPHPPEQDLVPSRDGSSVGHWEGDTLVVETIGLKEAVDQSSAHSDKAKIVERYHLSKNDAGRKMLVAEMTLTDPVFYTRAVTAKKTWLWLEDGRVMPYECTEPQWEDLLEKMRGQAHSSAPPQQP